MQEIGEVKMDNETTLNSFKSEKELESFIREVVAQAIKERLDPVNEDIKKIKTHGEQIDALTNLYGMISDTIKAVEEKTYEGDIANAIREIKEILIKRGTEVVQVSPEEEVTSGYDFSVLPSREQLEIETTGGITTIRSKIFLGDLWGPVNDAVKALGGKWIRDGQNSRWEIGGVATSKSSQSKETPQIKDPEAPATEKQRAFLEQLKVYVKPNLTKGEASKLIDNKLKEKKSGRN